MKRFFLLASLLLIVCSVCSLPVETASLSDFLYGSTENTAYDNWASRTVEGLAAPGYNQYAPWNRQTNGFGNFVNASSLQRSRWGTIMSHFVAGNYQTAQNTINNYNYPYEIIQFEDTDTGRTYYMLREILNLNFFDDNGFPNNPEIHQIGSFAYGWGIYIFNPAGENPAIVNVVHPNDDFISIPLASESFKKWNARYLMISGVGREVMWSQSGDYTNGKSISDPSRNENHIFNVSYKAFCDEIRETFNRREFSVQIHSYDWTHRGYKNIQISAGNYEQFYPTLPIRDTSGNFNDVINASHYVVLPSNSVGIHPEITVTDYYSVLYYEHGLYYNNNGDLIPISDFVELPGISSGKQQAYTLDNWNVYNAYNPFFHIEVEELPNIYPKTESYYWWFYGFNAATQTWDVSKRYSNALAYYTPWMDSMAEVLPAYFEMDDGIIPSQPANLRIAGTSINNIGLEWDRTQSYDFYSYEILYATEPINFEQINYTVLDRNNYEILAAQMYNSFTVRNLSAGNTYYFRVRAKDFNGNYSAISNEVSQVTGSATVSNFDASGLDGVVEISWRANQQIANRGFNIWKAEGGEGEFGFLAGWETHPNLTGSTQSNVNYLFIDNEVDNGTIYKYKLSSFSNEDIEYFFEYIHTTACQEIYTLNLSNQTGTITDIIEFGHNLLASDKYDADYDIIKPQNTNNYYIYGMFYYGDWLPTETRSLERNIIKNFDAENNLQTLPIRISSNRLNQPLTISLSDNFSRNSEKLFIRCHTTGDTVDLTNSDMVFQVSNTNYRYFTLYWGNLLPVISFAETPNSFLREGQLIEFSWSFDFGQMIDSIDLYLANETDSLFIEENLAPDTENISWTAPFDLYMNDAKLVVQANLFDGFAYKSYSPFGIGILPALYIFDNEPGWLLKSNPLTLPELNTEVLFGDDYLLFSFIDEEILYEWTESFEFGKAYWLNTENGFTYETGALYQLDEYSISLSEGWNLIPNPFVSEILIEGLVFESGNNRYTYFEALNHKIIDRGIFGYVEDEYQLIDRVEKESAFWLYCKYDHIELKLIPFNRNYDNGYFFDGDWEIKLLANQSDNKTAVVIGVNDFSSEAYDYFYDLRTPPIRPLSELKLYLNSHNEKLYQEFKNDLAVEDYRYWDFSLEAEIGAEPVIFSMNETNVPDDYRTVIIIDDYFVVLSELEEFEYYPHSNNIDGQILVTNAIVTKTELIPQAVVHYGNYPNPFRSGYAGTRSSGTNIKFTLNEANKVDLEIFNIKGQKVKTVFADKLEKGTHLLRWEGDNDFGQFVASGVYFYRLSLGSKENRFHKMLMLK